MESASKKIIKSSFIIIASKWVQRILGIVSFFILARILGPEDFGIVAMSFIVLGFFRAVTETGPQQYLLSRKELTDQVTHVAWTLNLATRILVALLMVISAPFFAQIFNEARLEMVLYVASLVPIVNGFQSAGQFFKQRDFEYGAIAVSQVAAKVTSFITTLWIAIAYETYWALIIGDIIFATMFTIATYLFHRYRPRIRIDGIAKQWAFSKWILYKSIVGYLRSKIDQFIVSMFFDTKMVGLFNVSKELTLMPYAQISEPLGPVFISSINKYKDDASALADAYSRLFISMVTIMLPVAVGFYLVKDELVLLILGEKWVGAEVIVGYLVPLILTVSLSQLSSSTLTALEKVKLVFMLDLMTMIVVLIGQLMAKDLPLEQFAGVRTLLGAFIAIVFIGVIKSILGVKLSRLMIGSIPQVSAAVFMVVGVSYCNELFSDFSFLVVGVVTGVLIYSLSIAVILFLLRNINADFMFIYKKALWVVNRAK
jgi:lipopolysaccharide exporter